MKNFLCKLFSKEKVNLGRQYEVDLLKGFTLVILIFCHTILFLYSKLDSPLYCFADIIGSEPGAPAFMALMGIGVIYSKKQDALSFLKRGIIFLIVAVLLNISRSFPYWIVGDLDFFACEPGFFVVDIYQFVGLTFLLFALFKAIKAPSWVVFTVSIVFLITGQILMAIPNALNITGPATYFLNHFLPLDNEWCCFNLLTWFIFPCFGLMLGELLVRCKDKNKFYLILLILGLIGAVILYINLGLHAPNYTSYYYGNNFYRMGVFNTLLTLLIICLILSFWYFVGKILPSILKKGLSYLSKNIALIYVLSWVVIATIFHFQAYYKIEFSVVVLFSIMLGAYLICFLLPVPCRKLANFIKNRLSAKRKTV